MMIVKLVHSFFFTACIIIRAPVEDRRQEMSGGSYGDVELCTLVNPIFFIRLRTGKRA